MEPNLISQVLTQKHGKEGQMNYTEYMQNLCDLQSVNQRLILLFATLGQNTRCCLNCHTMMLCALLSLIHLHNLFLGLAKSTLKVWKENDLIGEKDFDLLQRRVNAVVPPPEIGRIPSKIATGFSGFTADQWKNWVCYYSPFALKGILPKEHYDAWMHFVTACRLICCQSVTMEQCLEAE